ncbi:MAG TPA: EAL domain-containing protein [Acidobacteriaceae bacterium]|nr:EAL domain-containing protein [Acidobacteriaceae bacterium]
MKIATLFETLLNSSTTFSARSRRDTDPAVPSRKRRGFDHRRSREIEAALRSTLAADGFSLNYQPIFDHEGRVVEVEALLRAQHPLLERIGPGEYIPIAEETGLILPIGELVLRMACERLSLWRASGLNSVHLAVNVSCIQMVNPGFAERALNIFAEHGIPPEVLHLELTETTLLRDTPPLEAQMGMLAAAGVAFSIDDFGTGYSTLERLAKLPISTMKIDQSFVREIEENQRALGIVHAMADLARHLNLDLIAEGVERAEQVTMLKAIGCHKFQGYFFSRPISAEQILAVMLDIRKRAAERKGGAEPGGKPPSGLPDVA